MDPLGTDIQGILDVDRSMSLVSGPEAVALAIARLYLIEQGTLAWAPSTGLPIKGGLQGLANKRLRASELPAIAAALRTTAEQEERLLLVEVSVAQSGNTLTVTVEGDTAEGPFRLVMRADQLTVEILSVDT